MGTKITHIDKRKVKKRGLSMNTLVVTGKSVYLKPIPKEIESDELLSCLKETGKSINKMLDIDDKIINSAIKECRKEWK